MGIVTLQLTVFCATLHTLAWFGFWVVLLEWRPKRPRKTQTLRALQVTPRKKPVLQGLTVFWEPPKFTVATPEDVIMLTITKSQANGQTYVTRLVGQRAQHMAQLVEEASRLMQ